MVTCYLDEAGGEQDGSTVVCGWVSTPALWEQFEVEWKIFLASYKVPYLHMKEFSQSKGPFKKWKDSELIRRKFMEDAHSIIRDRAGHWVIVFVDHRLFKIVDTRHKLAETLPSPYAVAGRACVAQVDSWVKKQSASDNLARFIFEDGGPDKGGLLAAMEVSHRLPGPIFEPSRDVLSKSGIPRKGVVQLQASDLLAYELRKHKKEFAIRSGRKARGSLVGMLRAEGIIMASFNQHNAAHLCLLEKPLDAR